VPIPEDVRAEIEPALQEFCDRHSSAEGGDAPRYVYELEANAVVLLEQRPSFMSRDQWSSKAIARFRYSQARGTWSLYWRDATDRWNRVSNVEAAKDIRVLLKVVVDDPLGVFWS
jgi:hypothetical protein